MLRLIGSVVVGYVVMAAVVFVALTGAYVALGADRAFEAGVYDVSLLWIVTSIVVGLAAALLGGWVARRISGSPAGPRALALLVLALGAFLALPVLFGDTAAVGGRTGAPGPFEAMQVARSPVWIVILNPLIGALGALVGGRALGSGPRASGAPTA
jgi:hypothetical protein